MALNDHSKPMNLVSGHRQPRGIAGNLVQNSDVGEARFVYRIVQSRHRLPAGPPSLQNSSGHCRAVSRVAMSGSVGNSEDAADDLAPQFAFRAPPPFSVSTSVGSGVPLVCCRRRSSEATPSSTARTRSPRACSVVSPTKAPGAAPPRAPRSPIRKGRKSRPWAPGGADMAAEVNEARLSPAPTARGAIAGSATRVVSRAAATNRTEHGRKSQEQDGRIRPRRPPTCPR